MTPAESIVTLQRFVDQYAADVTAALAVLADRATPEPARFALAAALNYVLDLLDIFPDHYAGLGVADDALVLRLAARQAAAEGATGAAIERLAGEASTVEAMFGGELASALDTYVQRLGGRAVRGRTVGQILSDPDVYAVFSADVGRQVRASRPRPIDTSQGGPEGVLGELRLMMRAALKKEGLLG